MLNTLASEGLVGKQGDTWFSTDKLRLSEGDENENTPAETTDVFS